MNGRVTFPTDVDFLTREPPVMVKFPTIRELLIQSAARSGATVMREPAARTDGAPGPRSSEDRAAAF
jgi:hypothetical protein